MAIFPVVFSSAVTCMVTGVTLGVAVKQRGNGPGPGGAIAGTTGRTTDSTEGRKTGKNSEHKIDDNTQSYKPSIFFTCNVSVYLSVLNTCVTVIVIT